MSILYVFLLALLLWLKRKQKQGGGKMIRKSGEGDGEESSDDSGISFWIVFNWPEYGILSFAEQFFLMTVFDLISCKAI